MTGFIILLVYVAIFVGSFFLIRTLVRRTTNDFTSLKTVTFGDESAVTSNRWASIISVLTIFLIWGSFTGSNWIPRFLHAPGPFVGETSFTYTVEAADGSRDDATVFVRVVDFGEETANFDVDPGDGFAKDDAVSMNASRSTTILFDRNDEIKRSDDARIVAINGTEIGPDTQLTLDAGRFALTDKGAITFAPPSGLQMEPIWLPPPEDVVQRLRETGCVGIGEFRSAFRESYARNQDKPWFSRVGEAVSEGLSSCGNFRDIHLLEHLGYSLFRVIAGFVFGALLGIPLGYAMGLSNWFRGWFEPIVEFMRPVPPLALIPLVIIWFGIGETGKIILLFLASLWIMAIAARAGVSGVNITKVHAAYSLGASKFQIMRYVIVPNSLPEIFTGARVAMGVCWGTVVAAELVAASEGAGMMIMVASKFQLTDIVLMGIILIGVIGFGIDMLMRKIERTLVPWKGRS